MLILEATVMKISVFRKNEPQFRISSEVQKMNLIPTLSPVHKKISPKFCTMYVNMYLYIYILLR